MLKTTGPVIIMTQAELEALIEQTAKKAAAEALKSFQAWAGARCAPNIDSSPGAAEAPARSRERPRNHDSGSTSSGERILRLADVMAAVGLKTSAIYKLIKAGSFPAQVKLGKHASGWRESEIQAWIREREGRQPVNSA